MCRSRMQRPFTHVSENNCPATWFRDSFVNVREKQLSALLFPSEVLTYLVCTRITILATCALNS
jgi:hypothetical protein